MGVLCSSSVLFKLGISVIFLAFLCPTDAYDSLDPNGNITIRWDIRDWNGDGYTATVTMYNFYQFRHIQAPGWKLGWGWQKREIIWGMMGGQTTEQGDCSKFKGTIPHCCNKKPSVVDFLPGTPYNQQVANCCRGGVLSSWAQDPETAVSAFQLTVGQAGTTNKTVRLPQNFTLKAPGPGYTCSEAKIVQPTRFIAPDRRRVTQALMTWDVTCTYSQFIAHKSPTCCVSLSSFYNSTIIRCPTCSCGCRDTSHPGNCVDPEGPRIASVITNPDNHSYVPPLVQCTDHMCPLRIHWHVKTNYREYWRVKITITNFHYNMNYSQWNVVVQHPNFNNLTRTFSFVYKPLPSYGSINDTGMLWGIKYYNEMLMQAGPSGNLQSELLFQKEASSFTLEQGWAFPRKIYFNGDLCVMPPPDSYPWLPSTGSHKPLDSWFAASVSLLVILHLIR